MLNKYQFFKDAGFRPGNADGSELKILMCFIIEVRG
jgi:hypothetical protein